MAIDIITTVTQTGGQFLSIVTTGGGQLFGSAVNWLTVFASAMLSGLTR
jgi:hypothetical protein